LAGISIKSLFGNISYFFSNVLVIPWYVNVKEVPEIRYLFPQRIAQRSTGPWRKDREEWFGLPGSTVAGFRRLWVLMELQ
jgi:hypothetical protein